MEKPLLHQPMSWESWDEQEKVRDLLYSLRLFEKLLRRAGNQVPVDVKTKIGVFGAAYHPFERALEVFDADRKFRLVYSRSVLIRMDGCKKSLKRFLLLHKLSS